jgi:hypothetical protein
MVGDTAWYRAAVESCFDPAPEKGGPDGDDTIVMDTVWWRSA